MTDLLEIRGIGPAMAEALRARGIASPKDLAEAEPAALSGMPGVREARAALLIAAAQDWLESAGSPAAGPAPAEGRTEELETPEIPGPITVVAREDAAPESGKKKKKEKKKKDKDAKGKKKADKKDKSGKKKKKKKKA